MKNINNTYLYDIAAIILAYLRDEVDEEGQRKLKVWLEESDSHKTLFARIQDEKMQYEDIQKILSYDAGGAWQVVQQKAARRRRKRLTRVYRVAVSVVIIFGVAIAFLLREEATTVVPVVKVEEITPGRSMAKLTVASGDVYHLDSLHQVDLITSLAENNGKEVVFIDRQLEEGEREIKYNKVEIPRGGEYQIVLGDGTRVYLNAQTELRFPESFASSEQRLVYLSGEAYFEVTKNPSKPFVVQCKDYAVKVLGTSFNVNSYEGDETSKTTLATGKVEIDMDGKQTILNPGQQAIIKNGEVNVKEVDVEVYTTWMFDNFRFQSESIQEIMTKLSRWYAIDVFYMNESVRNYHFTGYLPRYAKIADVLELLSLTTNIKFDVEGKTVIVMEK
ncbi:FecR family protein [Butyricimonas faecalis]|uniref:FecR family protein n=1 Tax=Butyricimonas faecalis TaxID=2093856 RepID=A0A3Q9IT25_9BACT|nr:FecR family protein [Butyricimonas faecalis]AZS31156.1 FecR family protein [Butyricimonas faecalis]